jgi:peptidoglycan hydrolase-like protein with peptidoglycan-binding domain
MSRSTTNQAVAIRNCEVCEKSRPSITENIRPSVRATLQIAPEIEDKVGEVMGKGIAFQTVEKSSVRSAQHSWSETPTITQRFPRESQNLLQRKPGTCVCGGGCPRCAKTQSLRTNLTISQPGDGLEREADLLAETVMRMPDSAVAAVRRSSEPPLVQRLCAECDEELHRKAGPGPERVGEGFKHPSSGGRPLSDFERRFFEPRFGQDLSNVRVHEGRQAAEAASSVNALAYALQNDIVFGEGQYLPSTSSGRALLAHELTHVVQQGASQHLGTVAAVAPMIQRAPVVEDEALCAGTAFPPAPVWFTDPLLVRIRIDEALMAFGSVGEPVALVQQALVAWGCDESLGQLLPQFGVDGIFGNETRAAVKTFQTQQSIDDDGIVGPITMGELDRFVLGGVLECPSGTTASAFVSESQPLQTVCLPLGIPPIPLDKGCPTPSKSRIIGIHVAEDPFSGRSLTRYGVGEKVNLSFDTERPELKALPTEERATFFGGGRWVKKNGSGKCEFDHS